LAQDPLETRNSVDYWFVTEVLPLEPALMRYLRRNWYDKSEISDLRQETYLRVYEAAKRQRPSPVKPFLFTTARHLIIDRLRHKKVVPIDPVADLEWLNVYDPKPGPEQHVAARQDLRRLEEALNALPRRSRQAIVLRRVHGYSQQEIAAEMGIQVETVEAHIAKAVRILADTVPSRRQSLIAKAQRYITRRR
jgi:RNA polymerase sigma factor (sigma-70 family)